MARGIVESALAVHRHLGPGLLEGAYEWCFCYELEKRGIAFERQKRVPLVYDGVKLRWRMRVDVLVGERIVCELKAVDVMPQVYVAQLLTELRLLDLHLGFLINFKVALIREGIRRIIR
jgi:GxxExxY protein